MKRTRQYFFPAAGLADDQDRHIAARHVVDAIHDAAQSGIGAHDGVGDVVAAEFGQQCLLVGFERFAQPF